MDGVRWAEAAGLLLQRRDGDLPPVPVGAVQELHPQDVDDPAQRAELLGVLEEVFVDLRVQPPLQLDQVGMLLLHHCRPTAAVSATAIAAAPSGRTHVGVLVARGDGWIIYVCCQQAGTTYVLGADKTTQDTKGPAKDKATSTPARLAWLPNDDVPSIPGTPRGVSCELPRLVGCGMAWVGLLRWLAWQSHQ